MTVISRLVCNMLMILSLVDKVLSLVCGLNRMLSHALWFNLLIIGYGKQVNFHFDSSSSGL